MRFVPQSAAREPRFVGLVPDWPQGRAPARRLHLPGGWRCRPPEPATGLGSLKSFLNHLHSGGEFGPVGVAISVLSGLALAFFSLSGLWVYVQMWRVRRARKMQGGMFWK